VRGQRHAPAALYPRERPCTHCTGGWVGPRPGMDRCGKSRPHRDSIPGPFPGTGVDRKLYMPNKLVNELLQSLNVAWFVSFKNSERCASFRVACTSFSFTNEYYDKQISFRPLHPV